MDKKQWLFILYKHNKLTKKVGTSIIYMLQSTEFMLPATPPGGTINTFSDEKLYISPVNPSIHLILIREVVTYFKEPSELVAISLPKFGEMKKE